MIPLYIVVILELLVMSAICHAEPPLPSWNEGGAKASIVNFVNKVTKPGGPDSVHPEKCIATVDQVMEILQKPQNHRDGTGKEGACREPLFLVYLFRCKSLRSQILSTIFLPRGERT